MRANFSRAKVMRAVNAAPFSVAQWWKNQLIIQGTLTEGDGTVRLTSYLV
jgi:hypothetical protein